MRAPSKCSLCTAQKLGTYSAVQCVSTDRIDKRWVVQVVLIASNVCGCVTVRELFEARLIFFSSSERSLAGLIQGQEKIEEIQYLKNYATYKNVTCTITFVRTCTFQWYQYCSYNVLLGVSTAKNYCPVIEGVTHSTFQLHPSAPKACRYGDKYQVCSSRVLLLPDAAKIPPKDPSEKEQETTSENTWFIANCRMFQTVVLNHIQRKQELTLELHFWVVRFSGLSLRFHWITDYLHA